MAVGGEQVVVDLDPARCLTATQVRERLESGRSNDVPVRASRGIGDIVRANVVTRFNAIIGVNGWRVAMLLIILGCMVYDLLDDWTRRFFALDPNNTPAMLTAVAVAGVAMVALELAWRLSRSGR